MFSVRNQDKKTLSSTATAYAKQTGIKTANDVLSQDVFLFIRSQVRDGAMSDLQTQLREVLRENELLRRDVSMASNRIYFNGVATSNLSSAAFNKYINK